MKLVYLLAAMLVLVGCARPEQAILGKWLEARSDPQPSTLEFFADGRMVAVDRGTLVCQYVFIDPHSIRVTGNRNGRPSQFTLAVSLEQDVLTLKYPQGKIERYSRIR